MPSLIYKANLCKISIDSLRTSGQPLDVRFRDPMSQGGRGRGQSPPFCEVGKVGRGGICDSPGMVLSRATGVEDIVGVFLLIYGRVGNGAVTIRGRVKS